MGNSYVAWQSDEPHPYSPSESGRRLGLIFALDAVVFLEASSASVSTPDILMPLIE
jgi:hypothetical protein